MATKTQSKGKGKVTGGGVSPSNVLLEASRRWHVPLWVLVGVKLMESGTSTGANAFQFEPGTARSMGVNVNDFSSSANGAARLLAKYHHQYGSWNAAFEGYNGGPGAIGRGYAYTEGDILAKLKEFGTSKSELGGGQTQLTSFSLKGFKSALDKIFGYALGGVAAGGKTGEAIHEADPGAIAGSLLGPLASVGTFFSYLTSGETWIRLAEILAGSILLYMGLKSLTGVGASDLPGAKPAKAAAVGAATAAVVK